MTETPILSVQSLSKTYEGGFEALKSVDLEIARGEIVALLGPNGAGKTTLISIICGLVTPSSGHVLVDGHDNVTAFREARDIIGLVPQELTIDAFETVWATVSYSRGLFGKPRDPDHIERVLKSLSLWDKKDARLMALSGGMKRRVLIAKALSHQPSLLFLDEPTAGVDVALRKDMWALVEELRQAGTTIILTTHYIEEAEAIADRVGVINAGKLLLIEDKDRLMARMGKKQLVVELSEPVAELPASLAEFALERSEDGRHLTYTFEVGGARTGVTQFLSALRSAGLVMCDLETRQSTLEDIFTEIVGETS